MAWVGGHVGSSEVQAEVEVKGGGWRCKDAGRGLACGSDVGVLGGRA